MIRTLNTNGSFCEPRDDEIALRPLALPDPGEAYLGDHLAGERAVHHDVEAAIVSDLSVWNARLPQMPTSFWVISPT